VEYLDRGLIAFYRGSGNVYMSWRLLGNDPSDIAFNVYRSTNGAAPVKRNASPITSTTDYTDTGITTTNAYTYTIRPIVGGVEQAATKGYTIGPSPSANQYLSIPLSPPAPMTTPDGVVHTYEANDASVGDVDGDGEYEYILKWVSNPQDVFAYSANMYLDAYKLNGTRLWRIDLGKNIKTGAEFMQFVVYDLDGDGKAEVACNTADGAISGTGQAIGDPTKDWRNSDGWVTTGPEYLTIFNGQTGAILVNTNLEPARGNVTDWGDNYGHRSDCFLHTIAYLDGQRPSLVMGRGIYTAMAGSGYPSKTQLVAWDWRNGQLTKRWTFTAKKGTTSDINPTYIGQGNHNLSVGDVDGDGKDEITWGAMAVDDNGAPLYSTGLGHGDAMHMSDMDPTRPGQEVFSIHEDPNVYGANGGDFRDARTGQVIFGIDGHGGDVGRGVAFDVDPRYLGYEMWTAADGYMYNTKGAQISVRPSNYNFGIWWDADPLRELLNGTVIDKWNWNTATTNRLTTVYNLAPISSNNGTKSTPCLSADLFGDWREEVVYRASDNTRLYIFSTVIPATTRIYTLMHDVQYREAIAWQQDFYNQPPHPSFFLGAADANSSFPSIPAPNIYVVGADLTAPTVSASNFEYETSQKITVQFSEPMRANTISEADLVLRPLSYSGYDIHPYTYWFNAANNTVTFYVLNTIPDGNYRATMPAGSVQDSAGNALAQDYSFDLFVLGADANRDRTVDINDLAILATNWQGVGKVFSQGDFNYDRKVDAKDLGILSMHWQGTLPEQPPVAPPTSIIRAPSRTATRVISLI
jgi:rhamnogalacturonan endolyase